MRRDSATTPWAAANVIHDFDSAGFKIIEKEVKFERGTLGFKDRYADIVATHPQTGEKYIVNIGKMRQDGAPIMRERLALDDIIFSDTMLFDPAYKNSKLLFIEKGAMGLPPGWNQ